MKKYIYLIISLIILTYSCKDDVLDTNPYNKKVTGNFYKTPAEAWEALVAVYSVLDWGYAEDYIVISETMSDNCFGGGGSGDDLRYQVFDDFDASAYTNPIPEAWHKYWNLQGKYPVAKYR